MLYTIILEQDFLGGYCGTFPDLPGCVVEGDGMDEVMANIQETVEQWAAENGLSALPEPGGAEPDFSDPKRMPMLVEVDESFLAAQEAADAGQTEEA